MKNVPEASDCTYTLLLCEEHAKNFEYRKEIPYPDIGHEPCGYGMCMNDGNHFVYLSGIAQSSSYTPRLRRMMGKYEEIKQKYVEPWEPRPYVEDVSLLLKALELACKNCRFGFVVSPDYYLEEAAKDED